ncbi:hypothetical protein [Actinophytocola xinjiangensis]|uniref:hypothetical protein n=1 Tax=Actinophytocola xinjiangensis TaxID=485602 RepID=UPI0012B8A247|nr:hypothetical protein [Actinophytocola xinjiangensis]
MTIERCFPVPAPGWYGAVDTLVLPGSDGTGRAAPGRCCRPVNRELALLRHAARGDWPGVLAPPEEPERLASYRWWIGHQATFAVWWLLAETLEAVGRFRTPPDGAVTAAVELFDCSTLLFLYTGSCTAAHYHAVIRPAMRACHPAFSGTWARDYAPIPSLLLRIRRVGSRNLVDTLTEAARRSGRVHVAVAARLVPEGTSLLRAAGHLPAREVDAALRDRYDAFFHVSRGAVCRPSVTAQFLRRLSQIVSDLAVNGAASLEVPAPGRGGHQADATVAALVEHPARALSRLANRVAGDTD